MSVRVAQMMSRGRVQTLPATARLDEVAQRVRRIGHRGWPVLTDGQVCGLLHQRDLERALEHGLGELRVRDIMQTDGVSLREDATLSALEAALAPRGRSCVAVVNAAGRLLGVVSRGDLLRRRVAAQRAARELRLPDGPQADLILRIAAEARRAGIALWLVGGSVRDLLLGRPCDDLDFLVEEAPRRFAAQLCERLGGRLKPPTPFGTLRWLPAGECDGPAGPLPAHIDFAATRAETYAHPAALPAVYRSTLRQDLGRRDFSINALAVPVAPRAGAVIDEYGGLADLDAGLIRVLHPLSFYDDPLRIVRAWRFRARFGFTIEPRTKALMQRARATLGRITGARLRNELALLLQEEDPAGILLAMQDAGLLTAMHPALRVSEGLRHKLRRVRNVTGPLTAPPLPARMWHALASEIAPEALPAFCERMHFAPKMAASLLHTSRLLRDPGAAAEPAATTLELVERLDKVPFDAAWCVWRITDNPLVSARIADFLTRWPETRPRSSGHDLRAAGLPPGPAYGRILLRLRSAWFDGEVRSAEEEGALLQRLVAAAKQDDAEDGERRLA